MTQKPKFCIDCAWHEELTDPDPTRWMGDEHRCNATFSLITGEPAHLRKCSETRSGLVNSLFTHCGPDAKLWEPKDKP